jgi:hypothetical protein
MDASWAFSMAHQRSACARGWARCLNVILVWSKPSWREPGGRLRDCPLFWLWRLNCSLCWCSLNVTDFDIPHKDTSLTSMVQFAMDDAEAQRISKSHQNKQIHTSLNRRCTRGPTTRSGVVMRCVMPECSSFDVPHCAQVSFRCIGLSFDHAFCTVRIV